MQKIAKLGNHVSSITFIAWLFKLHQQKNNFLVIPSCIQVNSAPFPLCVSPWRARSITSISLMFEDKSKVPVKILDVL